MIRYIASLAVFFTGIISAIIFSGMHPLSFVDLPIFFIVGILPFLFISVLFGFKRIGSIFSIPFRKEQDKAQLLNALNYFKILGKTIWYTSFLAIIIGAVGILRNLQDNSSIAPNVAIAILSIFYCLLLNIVIIIPFTVFIKKRLKD
jgi:flagellar motor component MotA